MPKAQADHELSRARHSVACLSWCGRAREISSPTWPALRVGQAEDTRVRTGVTVLLGDAPMRAVVDVRGGAPGTRDIASARSRQSGRGGRCDRALRRLGLRARCAVRRDAACCARRAAVSDRARRAARADRARRDPVRSRQWRRQGLGRGDALSRARRARRPKPRRSISRSAMRARAMARSPASTKAVSAAPPPSTDDGFTVGAHRGGQFGRLAADPGTDVFWAFPFEQNGEFGGRRLQARRHGSISICPPT